MYDCINACLYTIHFRPSPQGSLRAVVTSRNQCGQPAASIAFVGHIHIYIYIYIYVYMYALIILILITILLLLIIIMVIMMPSLLFVHRRMYEA